MQNKLTVVALLAGALLMNNSYAAESFTSWLIDFGRNKEVRPVTDKQYHNECGECHFAYQPGLLPAKSWEVLLTADALHNHFGDNAEMDADTLRAIRAYAVEYAADNSYYKRSRKIAAATDEGPAPLRITDLHYIKRAHRNIPEQMIKGNKDVKSLSYCDKCHTQAEKGVFDDGTVAIPNYPNWDD